MGYNVSNLKFLLDAQKKGCFDSGGMCLGVGTHDFHIDYDSLKKFGIDTISEDDMRYHSGLKMFSRPWCQSSKNLNKKLFFHFGYEKYEELDINERADIVWDLNDRIENNLIERYDLAFDSSSVYVANVVIAFHNIMKMLKIGGEYITTISMGDQTNRYLLAPSPNFLIDFFSKNGFESVYQCLYKEPEGFLCEYNREAMKNKATPLRELLPWKEYFIWKLRTLFEAAENFDDSLAKALVSLNREYLKLGRPGAVYLVFIAKKMEETTSDPVYPDIKDCYKASSVLEKHFPDR